MHYNLGKIRIINMAGITKDRLVKDLMGLGICEGQSVMMHSSLSAPGYVEGGSETVVDSLLEIIGQRGTLIVPAFRSDIAWDNVKNFMNGDCCHCEKNICPSKLPGFQGIIAETVRRRDGSLRSCHPSHSWIVLGTNAERFISGHKESPTPCGKGNPFELLLELDGVILLLGVQVNTITLWHYYEEILQVPYMGHYWPTERHLNHCVTGKRIQYEYPGIMQDVCRAAGILKTSPVGKSNSGIILARDFDAFMSTIFNDDPWCMVLRPVDRVCSNLAIDALQKAKAMLKAWHEGPVSCQKKMGFYPRAVDPFNSSSLVRSDCPAFAGEYEIDCKKVSMCHANGRHPDLFQYGGIFNLAGPVSCDRCIWNIKFPNNSY